jgi:hypothetical protein
MVYEKCVAGGPNIGNPDDSGKGRDFRLCTFEGRVLIHLTFFRIRLLSSLARQRVLTSCCQERERVLILETGGAEAAKSRPEHQIISARSPALAGLQLA